MLHALRENSEQKQNRDAHSSCDNESFRNTQNVRSPYLYIHITI